MGGGEGSPLRPVPFAPAAASEPAGEWAGPRAGAGGCKRGSEPLEARFSWVLRGSKRWVNHRAALLSICRVLSLQAGRTGENQGEVVAAGALSRNRHLLALTAHAQAAGAGSSSHLQHRRWQQGPPLRVPPVLVGGWCGD